MNVRRILVYIHMQLVMMKLMDIYVNVLLTGQEPVVEKVITVLVLVWSTLIKSIASFSDCQLWPLRFYYVLTMRSNVLYCSRLILRLIMHH